MRTVAIIGAALALAAAVRGDVIIGNFSAAVGTGTAFGGTATTQYKTFGFTMPATAYTLTDVQLSLNFAGLGTPRVSIYTGATAPETEMVVLNNPPVLTGQSTFTFTAPAGVTLSAGTTYWVYVTAVPVSGGPSFTWDGTTPSLLPSGVAAAVGYIFNGAPSTFRNRLQVSGTPQGGCYPDCNGDGQLNLSDFGCFQTAFALGQAYADCNGDGVRNLSDFGCFQTEFALGCP